MSGLTSALSSALSGLLVAAGQSAVVSRNVTRAGDADYSRREIALSTNFDGSVRLGRYERGNDASLRDRVLSSSADNAGAQAIVGALKLLSATIGDPQDEASVTAGLYKFQQALRDFENNPALAGAASTAIAAARSLTMRITAAATDVARLRTEAQANVTASVSSINTLLGELQAVDEALRTTPSGTESHVENQDRRDAILKKLSGELGLRVVDKADGGIAVYTDGGVTLFDKVPRNVAVSPISALLPGTAGPSIYIDGVQVSGVSAVLPLKDGNLAANLHIRDALSLTYEAELDEVARSLVTGFAETDQSALPSQPAATGLFTYVGAPAVPAASTHVLGLAAGLRLASAFDDSAGGNPMLLRDGGSNGAAYVYNTSGESGFQSRLSDLVDFFDAPFSFAASGPLAASTSLKQFATASAATVEGKRVEAVAREDSAKASLQRWTDAHLSKTGVNLDEEMSMLLSLEKSYQASAKVMTTVDQMFATLVNIVR